MDKVPFKAQGGSGSTAAKAFRKAMQKRKPKRDYGEDGPIGKPDFGQKPQFKPHFWRDKGNPEVELGPDGSARPKSQKKPWIEIPKK